MMDRLTIWEGSGRGGKWSYHMDASVNDLCAKLAAYEDTGLTPDDIAALKAEVERLRAEKESNRIALLQYASLRKYFKALISATLGDDYYNMGMDVYTCDEMACEEIAEKCGRKALTRYKAARAALGRESSDES